MPSFIDLGVKDFGDLVFKLAFDLNQRGGGSVQFGMELGVWGSSIKTWKTGCTDHSVSGR